MRDFNALGSTPWSTDGPTDPGRGPKTKSLENDEEEK